MRARRPPSFSSWAIADHPPSHLPLVVDQPPSLSTLPAGVPIRRDSDAFALWAALAGRTEPTQLVLGFHGLAAHTAQYWARALHTLLAEGGGADGGGADGGGADGGGADGGGANGDALTTRLTIVDESGRPRTSVEQIRAVLEASPPPWMDATLFARCLRDAAASSRSLADDSADAEPVEVRWQRASLRVHSDRRVPLSASECL